MSVKLANNRPA